MLEAVWLFQATHCPKCRTAADEWLDPIIDEHTGRQAVDDRGEPKWRPRKPAPYEGITVSCPGCAEVSAAAGSIPEGQKDSTSVVLRRNRHA